MKAVRFQGLSIQILRPRLKVNILIKGFMNLLVKSGPRDFNRLDEPETEREIQKRIMACGRLNQESKIGECIYTCK